MSTPAQQSAKLGIAMAVGQLVGDLTVGLLQNKTQRDFNKSRLAQLENDSRLKQLNEEQRLSLQKRVDNAVNDVAKLRIYEETVSDLGAASIYASASVYAERFKAQSAAETRGYIVLAGLAALLIGGTIYIVKKNKQ